MSPVRQPVQRNVNGPQSPKAQSVSQLFLIEEKQICLICGTKVKVKSKCLKYFEDIGLHHCLSEFVICLHYELDRRIMIFKGESMSRTFLENIKRRR
jgi:hypothetical protein